MVTLLLLSLLLSPAALADVTVVDPLSGHTVTHYGSMEAGFGRQIPPGVGLRGRVVKAEPLAACQPIKPAPHKHAFALIAR